MRIIVAKASNIRHERQREAVGWKLSARWRLAAPGWTTFCLQAFDGDQIGLCSPLADGAERPVFW